MKRSLSIVCLAGILSAPVAFVGCSREGNRETTGMADRDRQAEAQKDIGEEKREYRQALQSRYDRLQADIDTLEANTKKAGQRVSAETREAWSTLKEQQRDLQQRMSRIDEVAADNWNEFKSDTDKALDALERGYSNVLEQMQTRK